MDCREPTRIKEQTIKKIMLIALICLCFAVPALAEYPTFDLESTRVCF